MRPSTIETDGGVSALPKPPSFRPGVQKYQETAYAQSGQYEMRDAIEDSLLKAFPQDAEVAQILAKAHFDRGNVDRARGLFEISEGLLHDDLNVRHLQAIARREGNPTSKRTTE